MAVSYATVGPSPSSDTIAFDFGGQTQERAAWVVVEIADNYHVTDPIVQISTNTATSSKLSGVLITEPRGGGPNATLGIAGWDAASSQSYFNGAGWTLVAASQGLTTAEKIALQWNPESARTSNGTLDVGNADWGMIAAEIRAKDVPKQAITVLSQAINRASYW
jgi:hypothetical protein